MTDKEVGKIWENVYRAKLAGQQSAYIVDCAELIRKLVEERAQDRYLDVETDNMPFATKLALKDFGIDPKTWSDK